MAATKTFTAPPTQPDAPPPLDTYHLFHATRADLLARLGRYTDADRAYDRALTLANNAAEHALLEGKRQSVRSSRTW